MLDRRKTQEQRTASVFVCLPVYTLSDALLVPELPDAERGARPEATVRVLGSPGPEGARDREARSESSIPEDGCTDRPGRARPHLQVDGAFQGEGLGLLDVLVAELRDPPGPAGLRAIGRHHGHCWRVRTSERRMEKERQGNFSPVLRSVSQQPPPAIKSRERERAQAGGKRTHARTPEVPPWSLWRPEVESRQNTAEPIAKSYGLALGGSHW